MSIEREADDAFDGPMDKYGQPKISDDALDIEVRFSKEGPTRYRWYWDGPASTIAGPWRDSRQQAYREGQNFLATGRTHG